MVTSENSSHCSGRSQKVDYRGKSGTCNVCSAPCSSCFHVNKVVLKSNNESAGETFAGNTATGQLSIQSPVGGMDYTSDSFSENAADKASSRTSNASASDDNVVQSKRDGWRSPEGHDECLSCVSGTEEQVNQKSHTDSEKKYYKKNKSSGEISGKVSPSGSQTEVSLIRNLDDGTDMKKVQNTSQSSNGKNLKQEESPTNVNDDKPSDTKDELLKATTEHVSSSSPNGVASDYVCGDPSKANQDSIEKNDEMEVEANPTNESDDSDMVEQDVKVCDICGDAGREELLAICSRCSDGAEHTYCMRERLEKLPEGEWLCEECKALELVGNGKQEKIGSMDENEKNNSSGRASENFNNSDVEGNKIKSSTKTPSKRTRDDEDVEVSSVAKKPALESTVGSPKMLNSKVAVLSRQSSLKHLEKGRLQSPNCSASDMALINDTTEMAKPTSDARGLNLRGAFSKSSSFNSLNTKPKVKLVDDVMPRQKSVKEHASFRHKEGVVKSIGKSLSFRSTHSNRSESKLKMLSPKSLHSQDDKGTKERITFERQRSFKTEHPSNNLMMGASMDPASRIDKRPSSRIESSSLAMPSNHHEVKQVQTDSKSAALLRSSNLAARRTADLPSSTGDFKRPSKHGHGTSVLSSANGGNNTEQKYNQTSLKKDPVPFPGVSGKLPDNSSEDISDGVLQSKDITDLADRPREYSGSRFGPPSARSSRDETDNLKAAIEAAVLRKPGVYRKHRSFSQSDAPSVPIAASVASPIDHMPSARYRKLSSDAELAERPAVSRNLTAESLKEETPNSVKQSSLVPAEGLSSVGREGVHVDLASRDMFSNVLAAFPLLLKSIAIPEHEYIWQGSFEICRSGQTQTFELWDGIQAHLSTCASPKVVEAVNKLKNRIVLYEVSRASTWPLQFQENGVKEDNIALFFFAKDIQSHDKIYKVLLENMMKNDLALKGNINGVELLIFPSNQLPVNLQRWNMLFFLWGVFRGKKESSMRRMPENIISPRHIPPAIMSFPENRCSRRPITENASNDAHPGIEVPASGELQGLPGVNKRDFGVYVPPLDQLGHGLNSSLLSAEHSDGAKQFGELRNAYQGGGISSSCSPLPGTGREQRLMQPDIPLGNPQSPHGSCKSVAGVPKEGTVEGAILEQICHQNQLKSRMDAIDLSTDGEIPVEDDMSTRDLNVEPNRWLFNQKKPVLPGPSTFGHHTPTVGTSQVSPRNDKVHNETCTTLEKVNHVPTVAYAPHYQDAVGTIPKHYEHAERYFFPVQSQPVKGLPLSDGSMPWKTYLLEEDGLNDRAPNLELALGAERTPLSLGIEPLLVSKVEENHIVEDARKKVEDDVSASLSLSLSFPFPEKEMDAKPSPKTEQQLMSQRKHVNTTTTSRLLFGNLRDN